MLSIFRTYNSFKDDAENMARSITRMTEYINYYLYKKRALAFEFAVVVKALCGLIETTYSSRWDLLPIDDKNIHKLVDEKIYLDTRNSIKKMVKWQRSRPLLCLLSLCLQTQQILLSFLMLLLQ